jgi:hypothetical protein
VRSRGALGTRSPKLAWTGEALAVQPRIRLTRSYDQRQHCYLGYCLRVKGKAAGPPGEFTVGIGKATQEKFAFRAGDGVSGQAEPVAEPRLDAADYYKTSGLVLVRRATVEPGEPPPWRGVPPSLEEYRARGHRRLDARIYAASCRTCIWGCRMAVDMIVDQWQAWQRRYRTETFCYGPKSCRIYKAGPTRKVPGRRGMSWEEEDWVDDDATAHREPDE